MSLIETINAEYIKSVKENDSVKKSIYRVIKGEIETEVGRGTELSDANLLKVLKSISNSLTELISRKKMMLIETHTEEAQLEVVNRYIPKMLSKDEVVILVNELLEKIDIKNVGQLMGLFNKTYKDKYFDNKVVLSVINELVK